MRLTAGNYPGRTFLGVIADFCVSENGRLATAIAASSPCRPFRRTI